MFGSMKKAIALGAIVAVGAVAAPATSNAASWTTSGSVFSGTMAGTASGALTLVPVGSALRVTCDVTLNVSLVNPGATLSVTGATFANCVTNIPGCTVSATAAGGTLPWPGVGAASQTITVGTPTSKVYFTNTFGAGCPAPLTGGTFYEEGVLTPVLDTPTETINFDGTAGTGSLTGPLGTAYVDGFLDVTTPGPLGLV